MSTRLVFLKNGSPVSGVKIKREGIDQEFEADEDGQFVVPLQEGNQKLVVYHKGSWMPHVVRVEQHSSLLLVDLKDVERAGRKVKDASAEQDHINFLDVGKLDLGERYLYERTLGRGGMGYVIRAKDRLLNRTVAIKLLSDELQDNAEAQKIFLSEARHLATLSHPNLVAVHDISKLEDRVFMVIEYIKGETLEHLVANLGTLPQSVALKIAIQLTRVVAYLHDQGIIHRDLKLANAMVRSDGTLKLIDFGLARQFDELYIRGTRVRGTPAYMSPEQITGANLTPASDIYQMGVCLFELLTGRLPFEKGDMSYAHVHEAAPDIRGIREDIHEDLALLIASCLKKSLKDRPRDAHEVLDVLQYVHRHLDETSIERSDAEVSHSSRGDSLMRLRLRTSEMGLVPGESPSTDPLQSTKALPAMEVIRPASSTYRHTPNPASSPPKRGEEIALPTEEDEERVLVASRSRWPWIALVVFMIVMGVVALSFMDSQQSGARTTPYMAEGSAVTDPELVPPAKEVEEPVKEEVVRTEPEELVLPVAQPPVTQPPVTQPKEVVAAPASQPPSTAPVKKSPPVKRPPVEKVADVPTSPEVVAPLTVQEPVVSKPDRKVDKSKAPQKAADKKEGLFELSKPVQEKVDEKTVPRKTLLPM